MAPKPAAPGLSPPPDRPRLVARRQDERPSVAVEGELGHPAHHGLEPDEPAARRGAEHDVAGAGRMLDRVGGQRRGGRRRGDAGGGRTTRRGGWTARPKAVVAGAGTPSARPGERPARRATTGAAGRTARGSAWRPDAGTRRRFPCHNRGMARDLDRPIREAWIVDAVRTPIGRYGGALASVRPDDLAAVVIARDRRADRHRPVADRGRRVRLRERRGRGQPQRRPHGGAARRAAGRGRRADRQPAVRLRAPGGQHRGARDRRRGRRGVRRRRRRVDDAGAVRDAQGRGPVGPRPADGWRTRRSAGGS